MQYKCAYVRMRVYVSMFVSLRDEVQEGAQWWDSVCPHVPKLDHKLGLELLVNQCHRYR